jgi:hypothetical protein
MYCIHLYIYIYYINTSKLRTYAHTYDTYRHTYLDQQVQIGPDMCQAGPIPAYIQTHIPGDIQTHIPGPIPA